MGNIQELPKEEIVEVQPPLERVIEMRAAKALWGAADLIETEGWIRGIAERPNSDGTHDRCILGALAKAVSGYEFDDPSRLVKDGSNRETYRVAHNALLGEIKSRTGREQHIAFWNDYSAPNKEEVISVLRDAAYATFQEGAGRGSQED